MVAAIASLSLWGCRCLIPKETLAVLFDCCTIGGVMYTSADYVLVYCMAILNKHQLFGVVILLRW